MVYENQGPLTSYEERKHLRAQLVYARQTRERQIFMEELRILRKRREKETNRMIRDMVGPRWYQVLSVPQRDALDLLEFSIYQDILEGRPVRTAGIMRKLGIYPRPHTADLMSCVNEGHEDPKQMLAHLYLLTYGHPIEGKKAWYPLNARLMLSAILYLGLKNLIHLLRERFKFNGEEKPPTPKPKPKPEPPLASPYLQKMIAVLYLPPERKKKRPAPLPNLDDLNEPYEEEPIMPKPPPPPPPPPPPKKRLARSYCDKLAGINPIEPYSSVTALTVKTVTRTTRKMRGSSHNVTQVKKTYGIGITYQKKGNRRRKLVPPQTGLRNAQYLINGVFKVRGKTVFVLGSVSILPPLGELIHGGFKSTDGGFINVHCGFRGILPPPKPDPCDCVPKWQESVFKYIKNSKCYCGHNFDYGNDGVFPNEELPFFEKPKPNAPYKFNYHTIYDTDEKHLLVDKEFKRIWDTDSVLHEDDGTDKKDKKKKKVKRDSATCLGQNPKPEDYLRCALRFMRRVNIAAKLPDAYRVPELREWMRRRIYGAFSQRERNEFLRKSNAFFQLFHTREMKGYGHVASKKEPMFGGHTNWVHKLSLNQKFRKYTQQYRLDLFRSFANINNLLWPAMFQAEFPDKKYREIYFSYLFGTFEDLQLMHPYSTRETVERKYKMMKNRQICLPAGIEPPE